MTTQTTFNRDPDPHSVNANANFNTTGVPVNYGNHIVPGDLPGTVARWGQIIVLAGGTATASMKLSVVGELTSYIGSIGIWELLDGEGALYAQGNTTINTRLSETVNGTVVFELEAQITVPQNIPVHGGGSDYQVRWTVNSPIQQSLTTFSSIRIVGPVYEEVGALPQLELTGTPVTASLILESPPDNNDTDVTFNLFRGNQALISRYVPGTSLNSLSRTVDFQPESYGITASVVPNNMVWRVKSRGASYTYSADLWVINSTILQAANDVLNFLNKAYQESGQEPSTAITPIDCIRYLRRGMDVFNGVGKATVFTMINATGGVRDAWVGYSAAEASRAQYLAEGMKAFNFSGQSTTLEVDRTTFWDSMATNIESRLNNTVPAYKTTIARWGYQGGDGNIQGPRPGALGVTGLMVSPISPLRTSGAASIIPFAY